MQNTKSGKTQNGFWKNKYYIIIYPYFNFKIPNSFHLLSIV